jgi:MFS family permease
MSKIKINKQLIYLFTGSFVVLFVGMGLFPLLPLYFAKFGANQSMIGVFFGLIYIANAAGPMTIGWVSDRISRRTLFTTASLLGLPALILIGLADSLWQVIVLTGIVWYSGGLCLALISIFTGLQTDKSNRGRSFSLVSISIPLGSLIGGAVIGMLVSSYGYGLLFLVLGGVWSILPILGWVLIEDAQDSRQAAPVSQKGATAERISGRYYLLMLASLFSATTIATGRLGTPLLMNNLEFSASAITSSATISGLVAIPITLLIGVLSDRLGRQHFLVLIYLLAAGGAIGLSFAGQLWQFWLVATMTLVAFVINGAMASALATDLLPEKQLSKGISWINTANSVGAILSFMTAGYLMELLGAKSLFMIASALPLVSAALVESIAKKPAAQELSTAQALTKDAVSDGKSIEGLQPCLECG